MLHGKRLDKLRMYKHKTDICTKTRRRCVAYRSNFGFAALFYKNWLCVKAHRIAFSKTMILILLLPKIFMNRDIYMRNFEIDKDSWALRRIETLSPQRENQPPRYCEHETRDSVPNQLGRRWRGERRRLGCEGEFYAEMEKSWWDRYRRYAFGAQRASRRKREKW